MKIEKLQLAGFAGFLDYLNDHLSGTKHRCLLGMGVHRDHRRQRLGQQLLAHAEQWALMAGVQWIDLQVLSVNTPAMQLYDSSGYRKTGEIPNMFLIDGQHFSYTLMTKRLR